MFDDSDRWTQAKATAEAKAAQRQPPAAPQRCRNGTVIVRVALAALAAPATLRELAAVANISIETANRALYHLYRRGELIIDRTVKPHTYELRRNG